MRSISLAHCVRLVGAGRRGWALKLDEWCAQAQEDQNLHGISHLYANFRHSLAKGLLPAKSVGDFVSALNRFLARPASAIHSDSACGYSDAAVELARY